MGIFLVTKSKVQRMKFACTLLFQFRRNNSLSKRRLCEERIFAFYDRDEESAYKQSIRIGKDEEMIFNYASYTEFYEFVGVMQLVELSVSESRNEIWHRFREMITPKERRKKLIPPKNKLDVFTRQKRFLKKYKERSSVKVKK
jgi:hypothetical protein